MSRDFTPREMFFVSIKNDPFQKILDMKWKIGNGIEKEMYTKEEKERIKEYRILGYCSPDLILWVYRVAEEKGVDASAILKKLDDSVRELVKGHNEKVDPTIRKWFDGELDEKFYYSERNDSLFKVYIREHILEQEQYVFDDDLYVQDEKTEIIDAYLCITDDLAVKIENEVGESMDAIENVNLYAFYNLRTDIIKLSGSYYKEDTQYAFNLELSDEETKTLKESLESYCWMCEGMTCLNYVNSVRKEDGLEPIQVREKIHESER